MPDRTKRSIVHFSSPFDLAGLGGVQPAGDYAVDEDEDLIEGLSWLAYRRVATFIHLPAIATRSASRQMVPVDHAQLQAALAHDAVRAHSF